MVPATHRNRDLIKNWVENQNFKDGGTNFVTAFDEAFNVISRSVKNKATSMCHKAIMFLTDGISNSLILYDQVKQKAIDLGVFVFSFAIGSGADKSVSKRLAC